jgi:hypothetical protein
VLAGAELSNKLDVERRRERKGATKRPRTKFMVVKRPSDRTWERQGAKME